MTRTKLFKTTRILASATALCFVCMSVVAGADAQTVGGSFGSGGTTGSLGASLGGGGMSAGGSGSGPSGTTGNGGLSIGGGNGLAANSSSGTTGNTRTNFTSTFGRNNSNGNANLGSGDTTTGLSFGDLGTGAPSTGTGAPSTSPQIGSNPGAIANAVSNLSFHDRQKLAKRCVSVLAAPRRYDGNTIAVCKVVASL